MKEKALLYIHGKNGQADEAEHYKPLFPNYQVIGLDYHGQTPWETKKEFLEIYNQLIRHYDHISIVANSIGAYFAMNAWGDKNIEHAFFISPIADMAKLIANMMNWFNITEEELAKNKEILTPSGETLSWSYLCYVKENPIKWKVPTDILYGENDNLTSYDTISLFAERCNATLTVMKGGEHWFHTDEQMQFLDNWLKRYLK